MRPQLLSQTFHVVLFLRFFRINGIIQKYEIEPFCWSPGGGYRCKVWLLQSVCRLFRGNFEFWLCYNVVCLWFSLVYHLILLKICIFYELGISCYFVVLNWRCVWFVASGFQASAVSHPSHRLLRFSLQVTFEPLLVGPLRRVFIFELKPRMHLCYSSFLCSMQKETITHALLHQLLSFCMLVLFRARCKLFYVQTLFNNELLL